MKKLQFRTNYNNLAPYKGAENNSPSQTIQGEAQTIQELFQRAAIQGHFPVENNEAFYNDLEIDEIHSMHRRGLDITDLVEHRKHLVEMEQTIQKQILNQKSKQILKQQKEQQKHAKTASSDPERSDSEQEANKSA